jgi:AAA family ATP:ADP antiporter
MAIINIKSKERKPAALLFFMFFSIVSATITGASVRDAVFLTQFDKSYLPVMFITIAVVMAGVIALYKKLTAGQDQIFVISISGALFSVSLFLLQSNLSGLFIPVLYIWMEVVTILSIFQFWILAGEIFNARQAKRIFTLLGAGGSFAGMGAGYGIKPFVSTFGSENLLFLTIFFIGLSVVMAQMLRPFRMSRKSKKVNSKPVAKSKTEFEPYLKSIALLIGLAAFVSKIIDYQFKMMAADAFPNQNDLVSFFGTYYMSTGAATLIMQFFVTGFILTRFGILAGLLVLPIFLAIGSSGFLAIGTLSAVFIAKFSDQVFKFSTNNAVQEILWLPVAPEKKKRAKPIIDGTIRSGLEGLAGVLIFSLVSFKLVPQDNIQLLSLLVILGVIFWLWNSFRLKDGYVNSLMKAIENRQLNLDDVEFDINDSHIVDTIDKTLKDDDELKQLFALDLLWTLPLHPWKNTLQYLFHHGSNQIQRAVLELAWHQPGIITDQLLLNSFKEDSELAPFAICCAGDRIIPDIAEKVSPFLKSDNPSLSAAAAVGILKQDTNHHESKLILDSLMESDDPTILCTTIGFLKQSGQWISTENKKRFLGHESHDVRNQILAVFKGSPDSDFLVSIIRNLANATTFDAAESALKQYDPSLVTDRFYHFLFAEDSPLRLKLGILKTAHEFSSSDMAELLSSGLNDPDLLILNGISNALVKISKNKELEAEILNKIENHIEAISNRAFQLYLLRDQLKNVSQAFLIQDHIESDLNKVIPILLKLGTLKKPDIPIETYIRYVKSNDPDLLPIVLELVDSTFSPENRKHTLPLIDPDVDRIKIGQELFPDLFRNPNDMLGHWIKNPHFWKTGIALQYLLNSENTAVLKIIKWDKIPNSIFTSNLFNETEQNYLNRNFLNNKFPIQENPPMYSILEKTIILKSVDLFHNIPGDVLTRIAQIAEELRCEQNHVIFKEGDQGDSMFVIISGKVDVIQNDHSITQLERGTCIGEMALLDQEPRSADAITLEESVLLKIDQEGFFQLMASNPEIMKQIVKILTRRVRSMNKKLTNAQQ